MLNQYNDLRINAVAVERRGIGGRESDWCVGEPAGRWDVSFGARLADKLKRWLGLGLGVEDAGRVDVQAPTTMKVMPAREAMAVRKAA